MEVEALRGIDAMTPLQKLRPAPSRPRAPGKIRAARIASAPAARPATLRKRGRSSRRTVALAQAGPSDLREAYQRGNARLLSGDTRAAVQAYEEAVQRNPRDPAGYRGLGLAYAQQGDRDRAIRYLRQYLRIAPKAADSALVAKRIKLLSGAP
jgi:tetratricopeptide (TPR) repeat protein